MTSPTTMAARFAGTCACGTGINVGDPINYVRGMAATHAACGAPTRSTTGRPARGARPARRTYYAEPCRHIDFPCCGCDPDGSRGFGADCYNQD